MPLSAPVRHSSRTSKLPRSGAIVQTDSRRACARFFFGCSLQTLIRLRIPSAAPYFFAGLRVAAALALIGAVVAEFVAGTGGTRSGLAYQILMAGLQLNIPRLFAALILITLTGIALFLLVTALAKISLHRWHESELPREP